MIDIRTDKLEKLYSNVASAKVRYEEAISKFEELYGSVDALGSAEFGIFSAPGRTEVGGNHTDHQQGNVLASAINLDIICVAKTTDGNNVNFRSEGFNQEILDLSELEPHENDSQSSALIRGVAAYFKASGYKVGGFNSYLTSDVLVGSGLSSSAAFEVVIGQVFNHLYNDGKVSNVRIAQAGQFAENMYLNKPSGLMDQSASSVGGFVQIDFADQDNPKFDFVQFDLARHGYSLCIVDTKSSHANLTEQYASMPEEMKLVAKYFGKKDLHAVDENELYGRLHLLKGKVPDRAILRAMHFFADNKRAVAEAAALKVDNFDEFLRLVRESGHSSFEYLQNVYYNPLEQNLSIALGLSQHILGPVNGAWRVHGGGLAGTIQAFVPDAVLSVYRTALEKLFGKGSCYVLGIRATGGTRVF
ncbi:galactokinase [Betaproteobacteria bacterium]|nr:galactokinase [Betaproteobacteria bacterium]